MLILDTALQNREKNKKPIKVGLIGAGYAATGFALQMLTTAAGMRLSAIANRTPDKADKIYGDIAKAHAEYVSGAQELETCIEEGRYAVTDKPALLTQSPSLDVIVEATGTCEFAAGVVLSAIQHKKHVVLINAELDATVGPVLKSYADGHGVVYTQGDGDQPARIMNLIREIQSYGLKVVLAGNIKSVLDHSRTPETQKNWAKANGQSATLATNAVDGTKIAMEMATVANATGLQVGRRGMYGPRCGHVDEVLNVFSPETLETGIVDYILGAQPPFGIFAVAHNANPLRQQYLKMFKMGEGPYYVFYTPTHLCTLETHLSIGRAALFQDAAIAPDGKPVADVIAIAKRDLKAGEVLDGVGGFTCYGLLENYTTSCSDNLLPMGVSEGCMLRRNIEKGSPLTYHDVTLPQGRLIDKLRIEQNSL